MTNALVSPYYFPNGPKKNIGPTRALDRMCNYPPV